MKIVKMMISSHLMDVIYANFNVKMNVNNALMENVYHVMKVVDGI